jgi:hypothetical protein
VTTGSTFPMWLGITASANFSREICGSPAAQASACEILIWVGAEKSTQTEVRATRGSLALRLNSTQRVAIPEPGAWGECENCGLELLVHRARGKTPGIDSYYKNLRGIHNVDREGAIVR